MRQELTDVNYWESYYKETGFDKERIIKICSVYDKYFDAFVQSTQIPCESLIEIGGYPGRYLAYLGARYKVKPFSIDFNSDSEKIKSAFEAMDVKDFEIYQDDINQFNPGRKFDLVFSNGFIEHFENYEAIMDKHVEMVNDGGCMMITVPNKRNFRYIWGVLFDYANLKSHNVKCLKKKVFMDFVKRNNLELVDFSYFGGFPYATHQKLNIIQRPFYFVLSKMIKMVNPFLKKRPNKYTCSLLICIARKPLAK